jgi:undecaprenyl phosphate N,N'-diacetylbacillosamine 1-phosphate transferase
VGGRAAGSSSADRRVTGVWGVLSSSGAWRAKRVIDVAVAGGALLALWPLLAVIAALVALRMGRPVIFRQIRIGRDEQPFTVLKFRTLGPATDSAGRPIPDAKRVTPLGATLRRFSLDELPQLINVVRGDISLVGPRPLLPHYLPAYSERERIRHTVRPGITGLAQVSGRNYLTWDQKLELDVQYVERWSLLLDVRIALKTAWLLVRPTNVAANPTAEGDLTVVRGLHSDREAARAYGLTSTPGIAATPAAPAAPASSRPPAAP